MRLSQPRIRKLHIAYTNPEYERQRFLTVCGTQTQLNNARQAKPAGDGETQNSPPWCGRRQKSRADREVFLKSRGPYTRA